LIILKNFQLEKLQDHPQVPKAMKDSFAATARQREKDVLALSSTTYTYRFSSDYLENEDCAQYLSTVLSVISSMDFTSVKNPNGSWPSPIREREVDFYVTRAKDPTAAFIVAAEEDLLTDRMCKVIEHRLQTYEMVTIALWRLSLQKGKSKDIKLRNNRQRPTAD
jgi:hypothetical protein